MVASMWVSLKITRSMARGHLHILMVVSMWVSGNITRSMARGHIHFLMVARMWASLKMTNIYINGEGRLVQTTKAIDSRIFSTLQKLLDNPLSDGSDYDKKIQKFH
jgi:hypothetical protein